MNCYLITNPQYESQLCKYIPHFKNCGSGQRKKTVPIVVKSREEFKAQSFKKAFGNRSDDDTVFIVPELGWDNDYSVECGYKVALDIIDDKLKDKEFFNLVFISMLSREQLSQIVELEYKEIVKSFPHLCLLDLLDPKEPGEKWASPLIIPSYSHIHFDFLKQLVISKSGRLEYIKHQVYHLIDNDYSNLPEKLDGILEILSLPAYGADEKRLSYFRNISRGALTEKIAKDIIIELREYIDDIKIERFSGKENPVKNSVYKVLIIEDDKKCRDNLISFFQRHFVDVVAYGDDEIVKAKERIKQDVGKYHIIILDLMYSTDGLNQDILPFNGLDLYKTVRDEEARINIAAKNAGKNSVHRAAVRLVTAVPRKDIRSFMIDSPRVFTKGNGWDQLEFCMTDRMDELIKECRDNELKYIAGQYAPKTGVFGDSGVIDAIYAQPQKLKAAMEYAQKVSAGNLKMADFSCTSASMDDPQSVVDNLDSIMAHRRLVIKYILTAAYRGRYYEDSDDKGLLGLTYRNFICSYLTDAGATGVLNTKGRPTRFGKGYLQTRLGFNISEGQEVKRKLSDDRDEDRIFSCIINLEDEKAFFKDEIDSLAQEVFLSWARDVLSEFSSIPNYDHDNRYRGFNYHRRLEAAYIDSGLKDMLEKPELSPTYLLSLITKSYNYIRKMYVNNKYLKVCISLRDFFSKELEIDDPTKRRLISNVSPKLVESLYKVIDFEFTTEA